MSYSTTYHGRYREPKETPVSDFIGEVFRQYIKQSWTGRLVYGILVFAFIKIMLVPLGASSDRMFEEINLQKIVAEEVYQDMLPADVSSEIQAIGDQINRSTNRTPEWFNQTLARNIIAEKAIERNDLYYTSYIPTKEAALNIIDSQRAALNTYRASVENEYGLKAMHAANDLYLQPVHGNVDVSDRMSKFNSFPLWRNAYFWSMIVIFIHFAIQIKGRDASFRLEVCSSRFWLWLTLWPLGIIKYPHNISIAEQAKRAMRFVAMVFSGMLTVSPIAMAQTKGSSKSVSEGTHPIVWVLDIDQIDDPLNRIQSSEQMDEKESDDAIDCGTNVIRVEFPKEKTRKLPDVIMGPLDNETRVSVLGWSHANWAEDTPFDVTSARVRLIAANDTAGWQFWSQFELKRPDQPIDAFRIGKSLSNGWRVEGGRNFASAIDAVPAPFLLESVTGPRIPVDFFRTGLKAYGPVNDNVTVGFDVTGRGGTDAFDLDQFDTMNASGFIKYQHSDGVLRLSVQEAGDTRYVADFTHDLDWLQVRGALHYRTGTDTAGGYMFAKREFGKRVIGFVQVDRVGKDTQALAGVGINLSDHAELTVEVANDVNVRLRKRF